MARNYSSVVEPKTLTANVGTSDTQITLNNVTGLPSTPYVLVLNPDTNKEEAVLVTVDQTGVTSPTLKVQRAIEASGGVGVATTHSIGHIVKHMIVGSDLQIVHDHFSNDSITTGTAHGATGGVVGRTSSQTLTNKAISLGDNTVTGTKAQFNAALSDADFATIAGTETLTNKTLTSPVITGGTVNGGAALTVDSTELNTLDGITSSAAELKILDGATLTTTELNYIDGVTSSVQTQIGTINTALITNTPVGTIVMWAKSDIPTGWLECNGQSTSSYPTLAGVVGANVPDMQGLVPVGFKTSDDAFGTLKGTGGSKTSTATHTHGLASHTHTIDHDHGAFNTTGGEGGHSHAINIEIAGSLANGGLWLAEVNTAPRSDSYMQSAGAHNHSIDVPNFGGSSGGPSDNTSGGSSAGATNGNLQPYFTLKFIIKH